MCAMWLNYKAPAKERQKKQIRKEQTPFYMQKSCRICGRNSNGADICQSCADYVKMMRGKQHQRLT